MSSTRITIFRGSVVFNLVGTTRNFAECFYIEHNPSLHSTMLSERLANNYWDFWEQEAESGCGADRTACQRRLGRNCTSSSGSNMRSIHSTAIFPLLITHIPVQYYHLNHTLSSYENSYRDHDCDREVLI
jgi:hypothetical protein